MKRIRLQSLASLPITNGLGLSGEHANRDWPRYVRTTDIATPRSLRTDAFASQPPHIASLAPLRRGDIVASAAGTIGKSCLYLSNEPACYAGFLVRIRVNALADARFVSYWMQSSDYWAQIEQGAVRSTIDNFSASKYRALQVPHLAVQEQRRIADFLDDRVARIDQIIAARQHQVSLADESTVAGADAVLTEVDWKASTRFGYAIRSIEQGWSPQCDSIPASVDEWGVLKVSAVRAGAFRTDENKLLPLELQPKPEYEIHAHDLLITRANTPTLVGAFAAVPEDVRPRLLLCDKIMRVRLEDSLVPEFASLVGQTRRIRDLLGGAGTGTSQSMVNVRGDDIRNLPMPILAKCEQRARVAEWERATEGATRAVGDLRHQIALLQEYKQSLITAAVTGEFDVTTASTKIPE